MLAGRRYPLFPFWLGSVAPFRHTPNGLKAVNYRPLGVSATPLRGCAPLGGEVRPPPCGCLLARPRALLAQPRLYTTTEKGGKG